MIFVDYLGPGARFAEVSAVVGREVAAALRIPVEQVAVRRLATEGGFDDIELWIELSSEEQLYRVGRRMADAIARGLRTGSPSPNVWVMYRLVPLSHAFLNGEPRARGVATLD